MLLNKLKKIKKDILKNIDLKKIMIEYELSATEDIIDLIHTDFYLKFITYSQYSSLLLYYTSEKNSLNKKLKKLNYKNSLLNI